MMLPIHVSWFIFIILCYCRTMADSSDSEEDVDDWKQQRKKFKQQTHQKPIRKPVAAANKPPV